MWHQWWVRFCPKPVFLVGICTGWVYADPFVPLLYGCRLCRYLCKYLYCVFNFILFYFLNCKWDCFFPAGQSPQTWDRYLADQGTKPISSVLFVSSKPVQLVVSRSDSCFLNSSELCSFTCWLALAPGLFSGIVWRHLPQAVNTTNSAQCYKGFHIILTEKSSASRVRRTVPLKETKIPLKFD